MTIPKKELFIWWTTNAEAIAIGDEAPLSLPEYVREQYLNRRSVYGSGSKELWVDKKFGPRGINEWPNTYIARGIREGSSSGIVIAGEDIRAFKDLPGLVTDFKLHVIVVL